MLLMTTSMIAATIFPPRKCVVLNITASMPRGLYLQRSAGELRAGELIVLRPPPYATAIAVARAYLRPEQPALKRIVAAGGDLVCRFGPAVSMNGRLIAVARRRDRAQRPLPIWTGCHKLRPNELFVLGLASSSFDGRYFGVVPRAAVVGVARPIWTMRN